MHTPRPTPPRPPRKKALAVHSCATTASSGSNPPARRMLSRLGGSTSAHETCPTATAGFDTPRPCQRGLWTVEGGRVSRQEKKKGARFVRITPKGGAADPVHTHEHHAPAPALMW